MLQLNTKHLKGLIEKIFIHPSALGSCLKFSVTLKIFFIIFFNNDSIEKEDIMIKIQIKFHYSSPHDIQFKKWKKS